MNKKKATIQPTNINAPHHPIRFHMVKLPYPTPTPKSNTTKEKKTRKEDETKENGTLDGSFLPAAHKTTRFRPVRFFTPPTTGRNPDFVS
ncbi:hypothetical protein HYFRA_00003441 [Hymenoscyphus fraxineus]|uniref:Uncharacterized protein n=1 Tax=Hymenoscyphus fraxineus TaxID=746836 RepID=A0A9N9KUQ9_9HELO|nr:hypothetical protein HYFRA_00003441 [Hymenoscyphus fraxineus]